MKKIYLDQFQLQLIHDLIDDKLIELSTIQLNFDEGLLDENFEELQDLKDHLNRCEQ